MDFIIIQASLHHIDKPVPGRDRAFNTAGQSRLDTGKLCTRHDIAAAARGNLLVHHAQTL